MKKTLYFALLFCLFASAASLEIIEPDSTIQRARDGTLPLTFRISAGSPATYDCEYDLSLSAAASPNGAEPESLGSFEYGSQAFQDYTVNSALHFGQEDAKYSLTVRCRKQTDLLTGFADFLFGTAEPGLEDSVSFLFTRSELAVCSDSDNGLNELVAGTCDEGAGTVLRKDECVNGKDECVNDNQLREWYCSSAINSEEGSSCQNTVIDCPYGCEGGACIAPPYLKCVDVVLGGDGEPVVFEEVLSSETVTLSQGSKTGFGGIEFEPSLVSASDAVLEVSAGGESAMTPPLEKGGSYLIENVRVTFTAYQAGVPQFLFEELKMLEVPDGVTRELCISITSPLEGEEYESPFALKFSLTGPAIQAASAQASPKASFAGETCEDEIIGECVLQETTDSLDVLFGECVSGGLPGDCVDRGCQALEDDSDYGRDPYYWVCPENGYDYGCDEGDYYKWMRSCSTGTCYVCPSSIYPSKPVQCSDASERRLCITEEEGKKHSNWYHTINGNHHIDPKLENGCYSEHDGYSCEGDWCVDLEPHKDLDDVLEQVCGGSEDDDGDDEEGGGAIQNICQPGYRCASSSEAAQSDGCYSEPDCGDAVESIGAENYCCPTAAGTEPEGDEEGPQLPSSYECFYSLSAVSQDSVNKTVSDWVEVPGTVGLGGDQKRVYLEVEEGGDYAVSVYCRELALSPAGEPVEITSDLIRFSAVAGSGGEEEEEGEAVVELAAPEDGAEYWSDDVEALFRIAYAAGVSEEGDYLYVGEPAPNAVSSTPVHAYYGCRGVLDGNAFDLQSEQATGFRDWEWVSGTLEGVPYGEHSFYVECASQDYEQLAYNPVMGEGDTLAGGGVVAEFVEVIQDDDGGTATFTITDDEDKEDTAILRPGDSYNRGGISLRLYDLTFTTGGEAYAEVGLFSGVSKRSQTVWFTTYEPNKPRIIEPHEKAEGEGYWTDELELQFKVGGDYEAYSCTYDLDGAEGDVRVEEWRSAVSEAVWAPPFGDPEELSVGESVEKGGITLSLDSVESGAQGIPNALNAKAVSIDDEGVARFTLEPGVNTVFELAEGQRRLIDLGDELAWVRVNSITDFPEGANGVDGAEFSFAVEEKGVTHLVPAGQEVTAVDPLVLTPHGDHDLKVSCMGIGPALSSNAPKDSDTVYFTSYTAEKPVILSPEEGAEYSFDPECEDARAVTASFIVGGAYDYYSCRYELDGGEPVLIDDMVEGAVDPYFDFEVVAGTHYLNVSCSPYLLNTPEWTYSETVSFEVAEEPSELRGVTVDFPVEGAEYFVSTLDLRFSIDGDYNSYSCRHNLDGSWGGAQDVSGQSADWEGVLSGLPDGSHSVSVECTGYCGDETGSASSESPLVSFAVNTGGTDPYCGDGICNNGETPGTCPSDCGGSNPYCGDGVCNNGETCSTCVTDCGQCGGGGGGQDLPPGGGGGGGDYVPSGGVSFGHLSGDGSSRPTPTPKPPRPSVQPTPTRKPADTVVLTLKCPTRITENETVVEALLTVNGALTCDDSLKAELLIDGEPASARLLSCNDGKHKVEFESLEVGDYELTVSARGAKDSCGFRGGVLIEDAPALPLLFALAAFGLAWYAFKRRER